MYSKDSQFYKGGVPQYGLPKDSPYREHASSAGFPAKQGPLQPGKDFTNPTYVPKDVSGKKSAKEEARSLNRSEDYDQYQIYN